MFFNDALYGYAIQYFAKLSSGKTQMTSAETFKVRTQQNYTVKNVMGMDEYYSKQFSCLTDPKLTSSEEQTYFSR
jgi:hypothetical protein